MQKSSFLYFNLLFLFGFIDIALLSIRLHASEVSLCSDALKSELRENESAEEAFVHLLRAARGALGDAWLGMLGWIVESEKAFNPFQGDGVAYLAYSRLAEELIQELEWDRVRSLVTELLTEEGQTQVAVERDRERASEFFKLSLESLTSLRLRDFRKMETPLSTRDSKSSIWPHAPGWIQIQGVSYVLYTTDKTIQLVDVLTGKTKSFRHPGSQSRHSGFKIISPAVPFEYQGRRYAIYGGLNIYRAGDPRVYRVYIMDLESGEIVQTYHNHFTDHAPMRVSDAPDGSPRFLIFSSFRNFGSGTPQKLIEITFKGKKGKSRELGRLGFMASEVLQVLKGPDYDALLVKSDKNEGDYHILSYPDLSTLSVLTYEGCDIARVQNSRFDSNVPTLFWGQDGRLKYLLGPRQSIEDPENRSGYDARESRRFTYKQLGRGITKMPPVIRWKGVPIGVQTVGGDEGSVLQVVSLENGEELSRVYVKRAFYSTVPVQWVVIGEELYLLFFDQISERLKDGWTKKEDYLNLVHAFEPELRSSVLLPPTSFPWDTGFTVVSTSEGRVAVSFKLSGGRNHRELRRVRFSELELSSESTD